MGKSGTGPVVGQVRNTGRAVGVVDYHIGEGIPQHTGTDQAKLLISFFARISLVQPHCSNLTITTTSTTTFTPIAPTIIITTTELLTKYRDDGFRVDLGSFGHFHGTKSVGGGSELYRFLLELEDWITAGQVSAGAGAEARGDWIRGKWKEVVEF